MYVVTIIVPFFGKLPGYTEYFLKGCKYNPEFQWIIFTDQDDVPGCPENVRFEKLTRSGFDEIASDRLGFRVSTGNPYKLCDFKPVFGFIFREFIGQASFWGYCDLDVIFGKLGHFITGEVLSKYDILSFYRGFLSGPFSLFRNKDHIINLFKSCKAYRKIFQDPGYTGFDENIYRPEIAGVSLRKIIHLVGYSFLRPGLLASPGEFRYQYQWYVKKRHVMNQSPVDMTEAIFAASQKGYINELFCDYLLTDPYYSRKNIKNWELSWKEGILTEARSKKEIMAFHFQENKNRPGFKITGPPDGLTAFNISPSGFKV